MSVCVCVYVCVFSVHGRDLTNPYKSGHRGLSDGWLQVNGLPTSKWLRKWASGVQMGVDESRIGVKQCSSHPEP